MPWQLKAGAPATASTNEVRVAILAGTYSSWLASWVPIASDRTYDMAAFCALGPETCEGLELSDALAFIPGAGVVGRALTIVELQSRLECYMRQRLFGAYCEFVSGGGGYWTNPVCLTTDNTGGEPSQSGFLNMATSPAFTTEARVTVSAWTGTVETDAQLDVGPAEAWPWTYHHSLAEFRAGAISATAASQGGLHYGLSANIPGVGELTACVEFHVEGAPDPVFTPPDPVQPPTAIPPSPGVYTSLDDIGAELDRIEAKLHAVLDLAVDGSTRSVLPMVPSAEPITLDGEELIELPDQDAGFIVTVSPLPPGADVNFGDPWQLSHVGRVTVGNGVAWLPPISITVSPMLITNLPPGVKWLKVHVMPPAVATVQVLKLAVPVG